MKCKILSQERWLRLLENRLAHEERKEVLEHLRKADCESCEEFLSTMDSADEQRLLQLFNKGSKPGVPAITIQDSAMSQGPGAGFEPSHNGQLPASGQQPIPVWALTRPFSTAWVGSVTALLLLSVVIMPQWYMNLSPEVVQTHKQQDKRVVTEMADINVRFAIGYHEGNELVVNPGVNGEVYRDAEAVFLNYKIPRDGYVYFVGHQGNQSPELLFPEQEFSAAIQPAGEHTVKLENHITGFPLQGIQGRYFIAGIYSVTPLDFKKDIAPLVEKLDIPAGSLDGAASAGTISDGIAVDFVYFDVRS